MTIAASARFVRAVRAVSTWLVLGLLLAGPSLAANAPITGATQVVAGIQHTCALVGGGVKCWGDNSYGQLGDGTTTSRTAAVGVTGLTSGIAAIGASGYHTCALTTAGAVKCWGNNGDGQLGDGTTTRRDTAVDVSGLASGVVAIAAGPYHTCALTTGGGAKCWGANNNGQLGDGTTTQRTTPVDVSGLTSGVAAMATGGLHTCALTTASAVKCWGFNSSGQLGDGTTTRRTTAVDVSGLTSGIAAIAGGIYHTCALTSVGAVKCWGNNSNGQLGNNSTTSSSTVVDVSSLSSGVAAIAVGATHTCALTTAGGAKCWGYNYTGQLGDGTTTQRTTAVDVSGLTSGAAAMAPGGNHTCALTTTGGAKCWGDNTNGQLGDGTTGTSLVPVTALQEVSAPTVPTAVTATPGSAQASLSWNAPASAGGTAITGYLVQVATSANGTYTAVTSGTCASATANTSTTTSCTATGLANGTAYYFKVAAINSAGTGPASSASNSVTPQASQAITFTNPGTQNFGTTPTLSASSDSGLTVTFTSSSTSVCTITTGGALTFVAIGYCTIKADQAGNASYLSAATVSHTFTVSAVASTAPTIASATPDNAQVSLGWTTPASNGGSAISGYNVQLATALGGPYANVATGTCASATANTSTATSCTATGLANGTTYYFKVAAINTAGTSAYSSASNGTTPVASAPQPLIDTIAVSLAGLQGLGDIANLTVRQGPDLLGALVTLLSQALNTPLQFVEQTTVGSVILRGYQGEHLAFVPYGYQSGDPRANGIYALGDGRYQAVHDTRAVTLVPALACLDQLLALLPQAQVTQADNGVLSVYLGGLLYVAQPSVLLRQGPATGAAQLLGGSDGSYRFIDAQGREQTLYPALREPASLRAALRQIDPASNMTINLDGTASVQAFGRGWTVVPDLILTAIPAERLGQGWWQEQGLRYYFANAQMQPLARMAQGVTAR